MSRPTVNRQSSWCQAPTSDQRPIFLLSLIISDSYGFIDLGHPLWWEVESVVFSHCWASTEQPFSSQRLTGLVRIFHFLCSLNSPTCRPGSCIYFAQEQGSPVVPPGTGSMWLLCFSLTTAASFSYQVTIRRFVTCNFQVHHQNRILNLQYRNKKFWEEVIACFPFVKRGPRRKKNVSNNYSADACIFVDTITYLPSRCLTKMGQIQVQTQNNGTDFKYAAQIDSVLVMCMHSWRLSQSLKGWYVGSEILRYRQHGDLINLPQFFFSK
jgi:hypothetical protein